MGKTQFGISINEELAEAIGDHLFDLQASRRLDRKMSDSEYIEELLTYGLLIDTMMWELGWSESPTDRRMLISGLIRARSEEDGIEIPDDLDVPTRWPFDRDLLDRRV